MGLSASININLYIKSEVLIKEIPQLSVLNLFRESQWKFADVQGKKIYLPLHDNESYNWNYESVSDEYLFNIFKQKAKEKEIIGVRLFWENSDLGVDLLLCSDLTMIFSIERGNRPINHYGITDFDWFLSRIIPIFNRVDFIGIECVEFIEHK